MAKLVSAALHTRCVLTGYHMCLTMHICTLPCDTLNGMLLSAKIIVMKYDIQLQTVIGELVFMHMGSKTP